MRRRKPGDCRLITYWRLGWNDELAMKGWISNWHIWISSLWMCIVDIHIYELSLHVEMSSTYS